VRKEVSPLSPDKLPHGSRLRVPCREFGGDDGVFQRNDCMLSMVYNPTYSRL